MKQFKCLFVLLSFFVIVNNCSTTTKNDKILFQTKLTSDENIKSFESTPSDIFANFTENFNKTVRSLHSFVYELENVSSQYSELQNFKSDKNNSELQWEQYENTGKKLNQTIDRIKEVKMKVEDILNAYQILSNWNYQQNFTDDKEHLIKPTNMEKLSEDFNLQINNLLEVVEDLGNVSINYQIMEVSEDFKNNKTENISNQLFVSTIDNFKVLIKDFQNLNKWYNEYYQMIFLKEKINTTLNYVELDTEIKDFDSIIISFENISKEYQEIMLTKNYNFENTSKYFNDTIDQLKIVLNNVNKINNQLKTNQSTLNRSQLELNEEMKKLHSFAEVFQSICFSYKTVFENICNQQHQEENSSFKNVSKKFEMTIDKFLSLSGYTTTDHHLMSDPKTLFFKNASKELTPEIEKLNDLAYKLDNISDLYKNLSIDTNKPGLSYENNLKHFNKKVNDLKDLVGNFKNLSHLFNDTEDKLLTENSIQKLCQEVKKLNNLVKSFKMLSYQYHMKYENLFNQYENISQSWKIFANNTNELNSTVFDLEKVLKKFENISSWYEHKFKIIYKLEQTLTMTNVNGSQKHDRNNNESLSMEKISLEHFSDRLDQEIEKVKNITRNVENVLIEFKGEKVSKDLEKEMEGLKESIRSLENLSEQYKKNFSSETRNRRNENSQNQKYKLGGKRRQETSTKSSRRFVRIPYSPKNRKYRNKSRDEKGDLSTQ